MNKLSILALVLGLGGTAFAGWKNYCPVQVNTASRQAYGSAGDARNSPDGNQYISCSLTASATTGIVTANCYAQTASGVSGFCQSTSPVIIQAAASANGDSYIAFWWDASNLCTALQVNNGSPNAPKQP